MLSNIHQALFEVVEIACVLRVSCLFMQRDFKEKEQDKDRDRRCNDIDEKIISIVAIVSKAALTIGATNIMSACKLPLMPFTLVSLS